jgi:hypothetical protein
MANTINLVTKFQPLLDEVYQAASLTTDLENSAVKFDGSKTVKVLKLTVPPLGTYTRNSGYTAGDVTADWEAFTLTQDRGTEFSVDAMDDEETLNMTFGNASSEFIRRSVTPQVDAYRFAAMAKAEGVGTVAGATLTTGEAVIKAIGAGMTTMDEAEVPAEGRILYITPTLKGLIDELDSYKSKACIQRFSKVVIVPQSRFFTDVTISDTGFAKGADAKNLNFLIVDPKAAFAVAKHKKLRVFDPDTNQKRDDYLFQYRLYHDMFVYPQKAAGIYVHKSTT